MTLAAAPPNRLAPDALRLRPGHDGSVAVDPARAGWRYLAFETIRLSAGRPMSFGSDGFETAVVILAGGDLGATGIGTLPGRESPFDDLPAAAYIPSGTRSTLVATSDTDLAIARAPVSGREGVVVEPVLIRPADIRVEVRGAGNATRQINHIIAPEFAADRLLLVEVLTPSGNWSSYPPHKHDEEIPGQETILEEIYYFEVAGSGVGYQRVYGSGPGREIDVCAEIRTGDAIVMPHGYHGPSMAAPGYDLYYLNVMAGPGERAWRFTDDPEHAWIRASWENMDVDPRVPMTAARRLP